MKIINKIKKYGLRTSIKYGSIKIRTGINKLFFEFGKLFPVRSNLIVMESEGDLSDNAFALYDYMRKNGYLKKYRIVWLVDNIPKISSLDFPNTQFDIKTIDKISIRRQFHLSRAHWYIYDHNNVMSNVKKRKCQKIIYLSHGWGYKAPKGGDTKDDKTHFDLLTSTGPLAAKGMAEFWKEPLKKVKITGYPRYDYFFQNDSHIDKVLNDKWDLKKYKKIIFWMPTFRQSNNTILSEDYIRNQTGLPLFTTEHDLKLFSKYLKENNLLMFFKLHHLQANLPIFKQKFDNIVIVKDEQLQQMGIQLYQFVKYADILISDYSSISVDYLLLDRPIIFTLDDYKQYDTSRGLFPKNAIDYMKGYHVFNKEQLENSLNEIVSGVDKYKEERKEILPEYHTYTDGNSSKRVLDLIGIKK